MWRTNCLPATLAQSPKRIVRNWNPWPSSMRPPTSCRGNTFSSSSTQDTETGCLMRTQPNGSYAPWWTMTSCGKPRMQPPLWKKQGYRAIGRNCGRWWERPVCDVGWAVSIAYSTLPKRCALTKLAASFTWVRQLRGVVKRVAPSAQRVAGRLSQLKYHR